MKALKNHVFTRTSTRESAYEWEKMLDGGQYELTQGDGADYACKTQTFCSLIRAAAKKRNLSVKTQTTDTGVIVQAVPFGSLKAPAKGKAKAK